MRGEGRSTRWHERSDCYTGPSGVLLDRKYNVPMLKITSAARIALLGIQEEDVDAIWAELGMEELAKQYEDYKPRCAVKALAV